MKEDVRIQRDRSELSLHRFLKDDSFYDLLEKLNINFNLIKEYQGGRQGVRGKQGPPGCSTMSDSMIEWLDENMPFLIEDATNGCQIEYSDKHEKIYDTELIYNQLANKSFLLSNLVADEDSGVRIREYDEVDYTVPIICEFLHDFKMKIYHSDNLGAGKHIHLLNTKAAETNPSYLCQSGFSIANDWLINSNLETLLFRGEKNPDILEHRHIFEFEGNLVQIKRKKLSQTLKLDPGTDDNSEHSGRIQLQTQNKENVFRLSDRTGWVGIWEDITSTKETWEIFDSDYINLERIKYDVNGNKITKIETDEDMPVQIESNSVIRFKRLNNWVLIDYKIELLKDISEFIFDYAIFYLNHPSVKCQTNNWHIGSVYESDLYDLDKTFSTYNFRILEKDLEDDEQSFKIILKSDSNHSYEFNDEKTSYIFAGQVWATVLDIDETCIPLIIVDDDACPPIEIS